MVQTTVRPTRSAGPGQGANRVETEPTVRVLIADAHQFIRDAVRLAIDPEPRIEIVGEARTGAEAVSVARSANPHVIVLAYRLPDADAATVMGALQDQGSTAEVVVLADTGDPRTVRRALDLGACSFLTLAATGADSLASAVIDAAHGIESLSPDAVRALVGSVRRETVVHTGDPTRRESEVWHLVSEGKSNAEVAQALFITERTVKYHVGNLLEKTGARSRAELVAVAYRTGVMSPAG